MKAVLDTNIIVSAFLSPSGPNAEILKHLFKEELKIFASPEILEEYSEVMRYPKIKKYLKSSPEEIDEVILELFETFGEVVIPKRKLEVVDQDPDDNKFVECSVEVNADFIVTYDPHLLELKKYESTHIVVPAVFLELLKKGPDF